MATIRFLSDCTDKTVTVAAAPGERPTLLSIARDNGIPVMFNCETGDCSACVVDVETLSEGDGTFAPLTEKEKFLLLAMVMLTDADVEEADAGRVPPDTRLACQYRPGDESIVVIFENGLG